MLREYQARWKTTVAYVFGLIDSVPISDEKIFGKTGFIVWMGPYKEVAEAQQGQQQHLHNWLRYSYSDLRAGSEGHMNFVIKLRTLE